MPYIYNDDRVCFDDHITRLCDTINNNVSGEQLPGIMNYIITTLCNHTMIKEAPRYYKINNVLGVLEGVKLEFYRRLVAAYEDAAIIKNGDIDSYSKIEE